MRASRSGKAPVTIVPVPDALEDEDMMEMLNLGLFEAIVVDDVVANMWKPSCPRSRSTRAQCCAPARGRLGDSEEQPAPAGDVADAYKNAVQSTPKTLSSRLTQYNSRIRRLQDPTRSADYKRFENTLALFQKYGKQYGFDPLMLAAQSYQESLLDQSARSPVGAIGLMQVMPATGKELAVGDITIAEANVHAGSKYMDQLMDRTFKDAKFDELNRALFAFAAYNCGPGNMAKIMAAPRAVASTRTSGSTTSRSSRPRRSASRRRPTCAISTSTTCPTNSCWTPRRSRRRPASRSRLAIEVDGKTPRAKRAAEVQFRMKRTRSLSRTAAQAGDARSRPGATGRATWRAPCRLVGRRLMPTLRSRQAAHCRSSGGGSPP